MVKCERCQKETDVIRHMKIKKGVNKIFKHNQCDDTFICVECYNNRPEFYGAYLVETIRG